MTPMEQLAKIESQRAKRNWDIARKKMPAEVKVLFKPSAKTKRQRMAEIIETVSTETATGVRDILSTSRLKSVCLARQYAMYKCCEQGYSYPEVGAVFERDHTTVMYAHKKIGKMLEGDNRESN